MKANNENTIVDLLPNIKNLYGQIIDKDQFILDLSRDWNLDLVGLKTNYFIMWRIPNRYGIRLRLIERMQKLIAIQNNVGYEKN